MSILSKAHGVFYLKRDETIAREIFLNLVEDASQYDMLLKSLFRKDSSMAEFKDGSHIDLIPIEDSVYGRKYDFCYVVNYNDMTEEEKDTVRSILLPMTIHNRPLVSINEKMHTYSIFVK